MWFRVESCQVVCHSTYLSRVPYLGYPSIYLSYFRVMVELSILCIEFI